MSVEAILKRGKKLSDWRSLFFFLLPDFFLLFFFLFSSFLSFFLSFSLSLFLSRPHNCVNECRFLLLLLFIPKKSHKWWCKWYSISLSLSLWVRVGWPVTCYRLLCHLPKERIFDWKWGEEKEEKRKEKTKEKERKKVKRPPDQEEGSQSPMDLPEITRSKRPHFVPLLLFLSFSVSSFDSFSFFLFHSFSLSFCISYHMFDERGEQGEDLHFFLLLFLYADEDDASFFIDPAEDVWILAQKIVADEERKRKKERKRERKNERRRKRKKEEYMHGNDSITFSLLTSPMACKMKFIILTLNSNTRRSKQDLRGLFLLLLSSLLSLTRLFLLLSHLFAILLFLPPSELWYTESGTKYIHDYHVLNLQSFGDLLNSLGTRNLVQ